MAKVASLAIAVLMIGSPLGAQAQVGGGPTPPTNREPYDMAIRCFFANGLARGQRLDAGDPAKAARYEAKAKESFGVAYGLGDALGFARPEIDADFERARREELPAMIRDQPYFYRVVGQCKGYGLM